MFTDFLEREEEKERDIDLLLYLFMHSLVDSMGDRTYNLDISGQRSNQLSSPAGASWNFKRTLALSIISDANLLLCVSRFSPIIILFHQMSMLIRSPLVLVPIDNLARIHDFSGDCEIDQTLKSAVIPRKGGIEEI